MPDLYLASEIDAELDDALGDIIILARGIPKLRLTYTAAEALADRMLEAVEKGKRREPPPKKEIQPRRRRS
jgi:hypothetical protein